MIRSVILTCILSFSTIYAQSFKEFKEVSELSYLYRMQINESYVYLKKIMTDDYLLSAKDIENITGEIKKRIDLYDISQSLMDKLEPSLFKSTRSNKDLLNSFMYLGTFLSSVDSFYYSLDQLARNYKLRRLIEEENLSNGQRAKVFETSLKKLFSKNTRLKVLKALKIYKRNKHKNLKDSKFLAANNLIEKSYTYKDRQNLGFEDSSIGERNFKKNKFKAIKSTNLFNLRQNTLKLIYEGSKIFGNTAGRFQSRRGKLFKNQSFIKDAKSMLEPLDTLLEKTPFRLTDKFIPGFWGHAAIYIGNQYQLKLLGIWNHPLVKKYHKQILQGKTIVEALRSGVKINSIKSFSDIDDFAILRLKEHLSLENKREYILRVLSHIGKEYDFAFNVETPSKIVCSELHYLTYLNVKFDIDYIFLQPTISVDSVARQGMSFMPFKLLSLYRNGQKLVDKMEVSFDNILKEIDRSFIPVSVKFEEYLD